MKATAMCLERTEGWARSKGTFMTPEIRLQWSFEKGGDDPGRLIGAMTPRRRLGDSAQNGSLIRVGVSALAA